MRVNSAVFPELDNLIELWVELVADQRASGPHLQAEANRIPIREALARYAIASDVLATREDDVSNSGMEVGSSVEGAGTDGLVGFVMFDIEAGAYEQDTARGMARNLLVRPVCRDADVGTRLLAAVEDALTDAGVDAVALDVLADNEAARRLYRRHGYRPHRIELEKSMRSDAYLKGDG